jgi:hypothetical protein
MEQRKDHEAGHSSPDQTTRKPVAWRYMLGDGKLRYQLEWSNGADMHPVYELSAEAVETLACKAY